jgi:UDP-N-acetylmuramoylalanine--D-glutamate ligase
MIVVQSFAGRRVAVVGLGASGNATARALLAGGAEVAGWDDGEGARRAATASGVPLVDLAALPASDWTTFSALVLAPGIPLTHPAPHWSVAKARSAGIEVIGDVEFFFRERARRCPAARVVAITGTNGKSTTTALLAHVLGKTGHTVSMGGNIGRPVLDLEELASERLYVIEMSSFQIDLTPSLAPTVGVHLNLSPDHLDRHGGMAEYAAIKERLVQAAETAVVGVDDDLSAGIAARRAAAGRPLWCLSVGEAGVGADRAYRGVQVSREGNLALHDGEAALPLYDLAGIGTLRGAHNLQNAAAAVACCHALGLDVSGLRGAIAGYPGLPHRMEEVGRLGSVLFINDSKATNADSTEKALAAFAEGIYWIVGGKPKEGGIDALAPYFGRIAKAYLIGEASEAFAATLAGRVPFERAGTLEVALVAAARDAGSSGAAEPVVLLSPACASYDQFRNFGERGDTFRRLVGELLASGG